MSEPNARVQRTTDVHASPDHDVGNQYVTVVKRRTRNRHAIHSPYTEEQWLPIVGPTAFLLANQLHDGELVEERVLPLATALGVGEFRWNQALERLVRFGLATLRRDPADPGLLIITVPDRWPDAPERKGTS